MASCAIPQTGSPVEAVEPEDTIIEQATGIVEEVVVYNMSIAITSLDRDRHLY